MGDNVIFICFVPREFNAWGFFAKPAFVWLQQINRNTMYFLFYNKRGLSRQLKTGRDTHTMPSVELDTS